MKKIVLATCLTLMSANTTAGDFACTGKVTSVGIGTTTGILYVEAGHGMHYLCKIHETYNGVHPQICQSWQSMFMTAKLAKKEITQAYNGTEGQDCTTLGHWKIPTPFPHYTVMND